MTSRTQAELESCRTVLLTIERNTSSSAVASSWQSTCGLWKAEVRAATSAGDLLRCFARFLEATDACSDFDADMDAVRLRCKGLCAQQQVRAGFLLDRLEEYKSDVINAGYTAYRESKAAKATPVRSWRAPAGKPRSAYYTDVQAVEESTRQINDQRSVVTWRLADSLHHETHIRNSYPILAGPPTRAQRRERELFYARVEYPLSRGRGYVVLNVGRQLAHAQLDDLREAGTVRLSSPTPIVLQTAASTGAAVQIAFCTDTLLLPPLCVNCAIALLVGLLGTTLRNLGIGSDMLVRLNPALVQYSDVELMRNRARSAGAAFGALSFPRARDCTTLDALLQLVEGVLMFSTRVHRGGVYHRHASGINAGASLFYVNPQALCACACACACDHEHEHALLRRCRVFATRRS